MTPPRRAVFFDFDGTITERDTFVDAIRREAPKVTREVLPEFVAGRMTLREGIKRILAAISAQRLQSMIEFVAAVPRRPGLEELLDWLDANEAVAVVVSSGLTAFVRGNLGPLADRFVAIHAGELRNGTEYLEVWSPYESHEELVAKADVLKAVGAEENAAIGDSITDRYIAKAANVVFARDKLVPYCQADGIPFVGWSDFHDVRRELQSRWR